MVSVTKPRSPHADWMTRNPLRQWRKRTEMTMLALAPMLDVSYLAVQLWENGSNRPTSENMAKLIRVTGLPELPRLWDDWYRERPRFVIPEDAKDFELFTDDS